ncbi:MAG: leuA 1, partial [Phycisphaerales bacterium]|nr:leuA 1 [Phycisphaerales bacterium]
MPRIEIYDTTLRDGTQGEGFNLSLQDKLLIAQKLDELGVDYVEGGFPLSNPKDAAFFRDVRELKLKHAKVSAFGMTRRRGVRAEDDPGMKALLAAETPVVTIVGKSSEFQVTKVLGVSVEENLAMIADTVGLLRSAGRQVVYDAEHFFDAYKADPAHALRTLAAAQEAGASVLCLCDTNGGTMPEQVAEAVAAVVAATGARVGIHTHNDCGLALANALAAVRAGASQAQGTINGVGERCGNMDLLPLIANLRLKYGLDCLAGDTLANLTDTSRFVYEVANVVPVSGQPYVGPSAFAHKGGMHVHAVQKDASTYEHVAPETVGNGRKVLVSEMSGQSNIAATVGAKFGIAADRDAMRRVLTKVQDLENEGYQFEAAGASYELLVRREIGRHRTFFDLDHYRCVILRQNGGQPLS